MLSYLFSSSQTKDTNTESKSNSESESEPETPKDWESDIAKYKSDEQKLKELQKEFDTYKLFSQNMLRKVTDRHEIYTLECENKFNKLHEQLQKFHKDTIKMTNYNADLLDDITRISCQMVDTTEKMEQLEDTNVELRHDNVKLVKDNLHLIETNEFLKNKINQLDNEITSGYIRQLKEQLDNSDVEVIRLKTELDGVYKILSKTMAEHGLLKLKHIGYLEELD